MYQYFSALGKWVLRNMDDSFTEYGSIDDGNYQASRIGQPGESQFMLGEDTTSLKIHAITAERPE
jgi:hypothetical protein